MVAEIHRKEGNDDELHDSILTANGDGDDAARKRNPPRRCPFAADGTQSGTQALAHELGRGHRPQWPQSTSDAVGIGRGLLISADAEKSVCNIPVTNSA